MKDAIIEKLGKHLSEPVNTECRVVYLLCEVRKLLEKNPTAPTPFALRMFCHWALHVDLDRQPTTLAFLQRVDEYVGHLLNGTPTREALWAEYRQMQEFIYLTNFRKELSQFLAQYDLPTALCDEDGRWFEFLAAYAGVIEDGSLACESRGANALTVEKVIFYKGRASDSPHVPFNVKWDILLKNNKKLEFEGGTYGPSANMHWGVRLVDR